MLGTYLPRVVDGELLAHLDASGAVVIEGPRACGKTRTARHRAASEVLLDTDETARRAIAVDPALVLEGSTPRLIDEWQLEPTIWNHVRRAVDDRGARGQFILTGSAVPADDVTRHSGAGRITRLRMRPMSLFESGHSSGTVSLKGLLDAVPASAADPRLEIGDLIERICVGGWPALVSLDSKDAMLTLRGYVDEIARADMSRVDGVRRDPERVSRLLRSLARNVATYVAVTTLAAGVERPDESLDDNTAHRYLDALDRLMVTENQPAWAPHLRSKASFRRSVKRHFVDPSLAVAALDATPDRLKADLNLTGFLFESLVVRDLRVYAQAAGANVLQYRDNTGLEVDAIVETRDGRWGAFEIKLGAGSVDEGASSLLRFARKVDTSKSGKPSVLAVIVGNGYGYVRPDGVAVAPIGALGP